MRSNVLRTKLAVIAVVALLLVLGVGWRAAGGPDSAPPAPADSGLRVGARGAARGGISLTAEPVPVRQGGEAQITARGFAMGETVLIRVAAIAGGKEPLDLHRAAAGPGGALEAVAVQLPEQLGSGSHTLEALGEQSGRLGTGVLWIQAREPWAVLDRYHLKPLEELGLVAGGFAEHERALVTLEPRREGNGAAGGQPSAAKQSQAAGAGGPVELAALHTDRVGNSEWVQVKIPVLPAGQYSLVVQGEAGGKGVRRDVTVNPFTPTAELSPWAGPPGANVQFNLRGFAPDEQVRVLVGKDGRQVVHFTADRDGNVWGAGPARIPYDVAPGALTLTFKGERSEVTTTADFKILEPKPWLELTLWWGPPTAPVGFGGGGWAAGERVTLHIGGADTPPVAEARADDYGWLRSAATVYVPAGATEKVTFVAVGEHSRAAAAATFKVVYPFGLGR